MDPVATTHSLNGLKAKQLTYIETYSSADQENHKPYTFSNTFRDILFYTKLVSSTLNKTTRVAFAHKDDLQHIYRVEE